MREEEGREIEASSNHWLAVQSGNEPSANVSDELLFGIGKVLVKMVRFNN